MKSKIKNKFLQLLSLIIIVSSNNTSIAQSQKAEEDIKPFSFNFSERIRLVSYDDFISFSNAENSANTFTRIRTTLSGTWTPASTFNLTVKLGHEFRNYFAPSPKDFHMNEIFLDQLYFKWKTDDFIKGYLTVGRQNMKFGEGFLVMDSSPLDGSRSSYFNAIRYDWFIDGKNTLTIFGNFINKTDDLFVINGNDIDDIFQGDGSCKLVEQNQIGGGLYYTGNFSNLNLQSYFLRKDYLDPDNNLGQINSNINTLGSRLSADINNNFSTVIEAAYQLGKYGDHNTKAFGGYAYVNYKTNWLKNYLPRILTIGAVYLSGDDPSTNDNEGWDPMFSRWPKWSEGYIYSLVKENGKISYWSNFISLYSTIIFEPAEYLGIILDYHHLIAPENSEISSFPGGTGHTRGNLIKAKLKYKISKYTTGYFAFEHFTPGNFYFDGAKETNWTRFEIFFNL